MSEFPPPHQSAENDRGQLNETDARPVASDPNAHISRTIEPEAQPPSLTFWMANLFFRPKRFFAHFPRMATNFTVFYATWAIGIMGVVLEVDDSDLTTGDALQTRLFEDILSSWGVYWAFCFGVGLFGAALTWAIGGWWYRERLRLSGCDGPDKGLARRVYVFASFIYAFPFVIVKGVETIQYDTPRDCAAGESWLWPIWSLSLFWSIYASYRGVRTVFEVRPWLARIWFAILPSAVYGSILAAALAMAVVQDPDPPDLSNWETISRPGFELRYPANWWVNDAEKDFDRDHYFEIEPVQWAMVTFRFRDEPGDPAKHSADEFENQKKTFEGVGHETFGKWGRQSGSGIEYIGAEEGVAHRIRIFSASSSTRSFTVVEWAEMYEEDVVEPGFQMIRDSFVLKD